MKLNLLRAELKNKFKEHGINSFDVDAIVGEVLGVKTPTLCLIDEVDKKTERKILKCAQQRIEGKPVQEIFKKAYFFGLEFRVNKFVLTPRPETELLVETVLAEIEKRKSKTVLDLCCGSGCVAISTKKNAPHVSVSASDISNKAINLAKQNAELNSVEIEFVKSNMFKNIDGCFDVIVSNPPYIATKEIETLDDVVKNYDPILALDGGADGLKFYRTIEAEAGKHLSAHGIVALEIGEDQNEQVKKIFSTYKLIDEKKDYSGHDRILVFEKI